MSAHESALPEASGNEQQFPLAISDLALEKIRAYGESTPEFKGKAFRVFIEGGGCAGFRYSFVFDDPQDDDLRTRLSGVDVAIDPLSMQYLQGATVDYVDSMTGAGFTVHNPNASSSCGCGHSFQV